jgi:hypothetical protein
MNEKKWHEATQKIARGLYDLFPERCATYSRADLSGVTPRNAFEGERGLLAVYLGGVRSNICSGTYGNSGEGWSYDMGNQAYGQWVLNPELQGMDFGDLEAFASEVVEATIQIPLAERARWAEEERLREEARKEARRVASEQWWAEKEAREVARAAAKATARATKRPPSSSQPPAKFESAPQVGLFSTESVWGALGSK